MRIFVLIILSLQLLACAGTMSRVPADLTFVQTKVANLSSKQQAVYYVMRYELSKNSPNDLFATLSYQDLSDKTLFHSSFIGGLGEVKIINFRSMDKQQIVNNYNFQVILTLYRDEQLTDVVGQHRDFVKFQMPTKVGQLLNIKLL